MSVVSLPALRRLMPFGKARDRGTASDAALVDWLDQDDVPALIELYRRYGQVVYADARRIGGIDAAESLTTNAFVALWRRGCFDGAAGDPAVRQRLRDLLAADVENLTRIGWEGPDVHERTTTQLLGMLPTVEARVLALVVLGACSFRETAELLDTSESAVRRAALRGLRRLNGVLVTPAG